jgi:hypothetical protein
MLLCYKPLHVLFTSYYVVSPPLILRLTYSRLRKPTGLRWRVMDIIYVLSIIELGQHAKMHVNITCSIFNIYSVGVASEVAPSVLECTASSGPLTGLLLDFDAACLGIGGAMYSNFRESSVKVTGPCVPQQQHKSSAKGTKVQRFSLTSLTRLTFIMAPNFPSVNWSQRFRDFSA